MWILRYALADHVGVETGDQWQGTEPGTGGIQPKCRLWWYQAQSLQRYARVRVMYAGGIVPHLVQVGDITVDIPNGIMQGAISEAVCSIQNMLWGLTPGLIPFLFNPVDITVDTSACHQYKGGMKLKFLTAFLEATLNTGN